uniref:Ubiquitinyl hydrolase 1 n=2 Tax=Caenorhabditis japonica TaxID=281687 RepID=A0A8R1IY69_CAEJA
MLSLFEEYGLAIFQANRRTYLNSALVHASAAAGSRSSVDMSAAVRAYFDVQLVDGYKSPVTGETKGATNTISMKTFPDYLFVQVQKFAYSTSDGSMKKLDIDFEVCEQLDLGAYRGNGKLAHEECLPDSAETTGPPPIPAKLRAVANELISMGFGEDASLRAAFVSNGTAEVATNWLMENIEDPHVNEKFVMPSGTPSSSGIDPNMVGAIVEMGFTEHQAKHALKQVTDVAGAIEWLFSNMDNIPVESAETGESSASSAQPEPSATAAAPARHKKYKDGGEKYELIGMISHMGSRPDSGHYVAHMLKEGKWVLFNDEKVALSQDPPKKLAYVYLYKRV